MRHTDIDLDTASRRLTGPKGSAELQPKTAELLAYLMAHPEEAIPKEELLDKIWSDATVTEGSLTRAMSILRKQLQSVGGDQFLTALHTVRGFGYRLEADAAASDGPSAWARESFVANRLSMIRAAGLPENCLGRQREAQELLEHFDSAIRRRQPQLSFLTGPPGIGKTFLLKELAEQLEGNEVVVAWGRAPESGHRPMWPWMEWIQKLGKRFSDVRVPESVRSTVERVESRWNRTSFTDAAQIRVALLHDLVGYLRTCSEHTPLMLILEDAHWCDATSLEALHYAMDHLDPAAVNFIATYRDLEILPGSAQEQHLRELRRSRLSQQPLQLTGLDDESVATLIRRVSGKPVEPKVAQRVRKRTDGNPLFVEELVRFHQEEGARRKTFDPGRFVRWVPEGLRTLIRKRIDRLPDSTQELLAAGAVLGRAFSTAVVAQMTKQPVEDAASSLTHAETERLIQRFGQGSWQFENGSVREAVLATVPERKRTSLHADAARTIERDLEGDPPPSTLAELAYHYAEAGAAGSPERAIGYCERAGRSDMERLAFEEAVDHLQRGIQTLDAFTPKDEARKARLLNDLAEASFHAFGGERYTEVAWEAIRFAQRLERPDLVGETASRMSRRQIANIGAAPAERIAALEWALQRVDETRKALRARILAALSSDLYWTGEFDRVRDLNAQALELAREAEDRETEFGILKDRWELFLHPEDTSTRRQVVNEALATAQGTQERAHEVLSIGWQQADAIQAGDRNGFDATLARLEELCGHAQEPLCQCTVFASRAINAFLHGELDHAEALADEEHAFRSEATSEAAALPFHATFLYAVRTAQGRLGELEPLLVGGLSAYPRAVAFQLGLALCYAETNRDELARKTLTDVLRESKSKLLRPDANQAINLGLLGETAARTRHSNAAEWVLPLLEPFRGHQLTMENMAIIGFADRIIGLVEASLDRHEDAERSLRRAFELELGFGSVPGRAYIAMDLAEFLAQRGASPEEVGQYVDAARELILKHDIRRLDARLKKAEASELATKQVRI